MRYIGKDIVTLGAALVLDVDEAWRLLRSRAKQGIRKAERAGVRVVESRDLSLLEQVWYDPATLPSRLSEGQRLFAAYLGDDLLGAIVITPITGNTLFYHYGGTNALGRQLEANAYLLWHVVRVYDHHPRFRYLDVGVSFRHELQHYFQKYCTHPYPIIFNPPPRGVVPQININPFHAMMMGPVEGPGEAMDAALADYFQRPFTYTPNGRQAIRAALRALRLGGDDVVTLLPSLKTNYVSGCVTEAVNDVCRWSMSFEARTRALLVIHEWGVPHPDIRDICDMGYPVIEDCAYSMDSTIHGQRIGTFGRYAIYSFSKVFPVQYGGALVGDMFADRTVWDDFQCLDVAKREIVRAQLARHWGTRAEASAQRRMNWSYLDNLFRTAGFEPYFVCHDAITPGVYLARMPEGCPPLAVRTRLRQFGIECGSYHGNSAIFLPCHQNLNPAHLDYIFGAFRGMLNPCHTYVRPSHEVEEARVVEAKMEPQLVA